MLTLNCVARQLGLEHGSTNQTILRKTQQWDEVTYAEYVDGYITGREIAGCSIEDQGYQDARYGLYAYREEDPEEIRDRYENGIMWYHREVWEGMKVAGL
jgi:hypothetical protein